MKKLKLTKLDLVNLNDSLFKKLDDDGAKRIIGGDGSMSVNLTGSKDSETTHVDGASYD
jgi:hypothetical protein